MDRQQLRSYWEDTYQSTDTPFDVDGPDEWIAELERTMQIGVDVLDCGCGPGRNAMYLAHPGRRVLGVDISHHAIERARRKAAEHNIAVEFQRVDVLELSKLDTRFDTVVDIGCFHSLYTDEDRAAYAATLYSLCRPNACLFLRAFSVRDCKEGFPGLHSPHRSEAEIRSAFENAGWDIAMLDEREIDLLISAREQHRTWAWFAALRRV